MALTRVLKSPLSRQFKRLMADTWLRVRNVI
jgi:hypothetical protein